MVDAAGVTSVGHDAGARAPKRRGQATVIVVSMPIALWSSTGHQMSYVPRCRSTVSKANCPVCNGPFAVRFATPGPLIVMVWGYWPELTTTKVYVPGLEVVPGQREGVLRHHHLDLGALRERGLHRDRRGRGLRGGNGGLGGRPARAAPGEEQYDAYCPGRRNRDEPTDPGGPRCNRDHPKLHLLH